MGFNSSEVLEEFRKQSEAEEIDISGCAVDEVEEDESEVEEDLYTSLDLLRQCHFWIRRLQSIDDLQDVLNHGRRKSLEETIEEVEDFLEDWEFTAPVQLK